MSMKVSRRPERFTSWSAQNGRQTAKQGFNKAKRAVMCFGHGSCLAPRSPVQHKRERESALFSDSPT